MKKLSRLLPFAAAFLLIFQSCQKETTSSELSSLPVNSTDGKNAKSSVKTNTFKGPEVQMGDGKARSWITITHDGVPMEIGMEITSGALNNLPTEEEGFAASTFVLPLHKKAQEVTPFDHLVINWEPHGHEPPGIYDVPHFDFHFYTISLAEQMAIPPPPGGKFSVYPPAGYLPPSYVIPGGEVPMMGKHWLDPSSPELSGPNHPPFTYTFIYGSYNGKVIFEEPMVTRAFLLSNTDVSTAIKQPSKYQEHSYYPTRFNIYNEDGTYYVTLSDFVLR
jgi:hypothetical protein